MESDIGPTIIVAGISIDEATAVLELRRRGFIVKHSVFIDKLNFAVCMSRKLTAKLAAENNIPVQPISKYSLFMQLTLANQAATIILRASAIGAKDCWVAHDKNQHELEAALTTNTISHPNKSLMLINGYYGSQIAMYYGFLAYYTNSLVPPMLVGGLLFFYQTLYNQIDCAWLPAFCLGTTVWSTFFLETWKGRCAELAYAWGVFGWEDKELTAELAKGASKEVSSVEVRRSLSAGAMLTLVYVQVQLMLGYNHVQSHAPEYFGTYWYSWLLPSVLYFVLCGGIGAVFHPISRKLNDFEMHPTKAQAEASLVVKRFAFSFVNQFSALFYAAFWQRDLHRVRSLLVFAFVAHSVSNQLLPHIQDCVKFIVNLVKPAPKPKDGEAQEGVGDLQGLGQQWDRLVRSELGRPVQDLEAEYLEMTVQFGHLSLFAVAFPLAPLLAYVSNLVEARTDFAKLSKSRRPPAVIRSTIGAWQSCLEFLSFASVFTNCFLLAMVSTHLSTVIPPSLHEQLDSDWGRLATMMTVEHALIALKIGIMLLVDDVPQWMRESLARDKINADSERLSALVENGPGARNSDTFTQATPSVASQGTPFTPTRHTLTPSECDYGAPASTSTPASSVKYTARSQIAEQQAAEDKILASSKSGGKGATSSHKRSSALSNPSAQTENIAAAKLLKECGNQFGFDPLTMSALIAIPPILQNVGVNPFVYVPLAVLYFSYLQAKKDRADRKTAIGIVSDPALIKLVVHEMPRWVSDTEHQRVEWFNSVLQRMWPQLSQALEGNLMAAVQGVLDKQVVAVRMGLTMRRFTLGNTSPKILGIRVHDTQDSAVRLDVDIRWAGDPIVALGVGKGSFAPSVELAELRLSAMIRIELLDLMPALPCFRAMSVTCMQTPDVHFSLKVGSLDFMNMGPADFNMAALVRTVIDSALQDIAIYPKKMLFPLVADENVDAKAEGGEGTGSNNVAATAAGVLFLTFERAVNLKKVNLFSCNPYLVAKTDRDQTYRTKTVHGSRSPEWKETFELLVFDPTKQSVEVEVLDRGASMGRLSFGLSQLVPSRSVTATMKLTDGDAGELDLTYEYIPMRKSGGGLEEDASSDDDKDDDILFSLTKEDLDSDVLCHSERELESLREHKSTHRPHRSSAFLAHGMDGQPAQLSTLSRGSHFGPGKLVVSQRFAARYSVGILSISLIHVRNLKVDAYLMAAGRLYVELSVADKRLRTKSVTGSTFPHFPDSFSVVVKDLPQRQLLVEVKSKHSIGSDKVLGTVSVALADVVASGDVLEQEYILHGAQAECFVGLRLAVTASS